MASTVNILVLVVACLSFLGVSASRKPSRKAKPKPPMAPLAFSFNASDVYIQPGTDLSHVQDNMTQATGKHPLSAAQLSKNTLDDKCANGLPLAATWQYYGPYARPLQDLEKKDFKGIGVGGIIPQLVNNMLKVCCKPDTRVTKGKIIDSIYELESELEDPQKAYDFTFPITGFSTEDTAFKDMVYIPIVEAPRIALLVMDKKGAEKTSQLLKTVTKAWPILVFILVAATLSGIIIWALVSTHN